MIITGVEAENAHISVDLEFVLMVVQTEHAKRDGFRKLVNQDGEHNQQTSGQIALPQLLQWPSRPSQHAR